MDESTAPPSSRAGDQSGFVRRLPPWLTLLAAAPILGELVSCHQTPLEFINPLNLLILSLPYGFGALICRELMVRWQGGSLCLLLLGIAFGVYEEGIVVYSLFDPLWSELGPLAQYGHWAGVNWTWAAATVQFHALISIGASVALAQMIHAGSRTQPWLSKWGLVACSAGLLAWIPSLGSIMVFQMKRSFPPVHLYILAWGTALALVWISHEMAKRPAPSVDRTPGNPWWFFVIGSVNVTALFVTVFTLPESSAAPPLIVALLALALMDAVSLWLLWRLSGRFQGWDDRHRLALVAGLLTFFVIFSFAKEFEGFRGSSIVGALTVLGLWRLRRMVYDRFRRDC